MSKHAEHIAAALRQYRAAEDAGDKAGQEEARALLQRWVRAAYLPCDIEAATCGVAGWVAPW